VREEERVNGIEALRLVLRTVLVLEHSEWQARVSFFFRLFVQLYDDRLQVISDVFDRRGAFFAFNFERESLEFTQIVENKVDNNRMLFGQGNHVL